MYERRVSGAQVKHAVRGHIVSNVGIEILVTKLAFDIINCLHELFLQTN